MTWQYMKCLSNQKKREVVNRIRLIKMTYVTSLLFTSLFTLHYFTLHFLQRAEGVLRRMKEAGITPEICSYNAAVAAWGRSVIVLVLSSYSGGCFARSVFCLLSL